MISHTGGRVTVFQASLPNIGPGALKSREDPNQRAGKDVPNLNPATDFYKKFALDCSGKQVAIDLFLLGGQYMDIASLCKLVITYKETNSLIFLSKQLAYLNTLGAAYSTFRASIMSKTHSKPNAWNILCVDI